MGTRNGEHGVNPRLDHFELGLASDERDHHFRHHRFAGPLCRCDGSLEDGACLHLGDLRVGDCEAAAAKSQHRIELVQLTGAVGQFLRIGTQARRDLLDLLFPMLETRMNLGASCRTPSCLPAPCFTGARASTKHF